MKEEKSLKILSKERNSIFKKISLKGAIGLLALSGLMFGASACHVTNGNEEHYEETDDDTDDTVAVTGVSVDKTSATMEIGDSLQLNATVTPNDATNKNVTWSSSDNSVATVADGTVTAVAAGTATITVTSVDGSFSATCAVTVNAKPHVDTPEEVKVKELNTKLATVTATDSQSVYERLNEAGITNDNLKELSKNYLYSYKENKFIYLDDDGNVGFDVSGVTSDEYKYSEEGNKITKSDDLYNFTTSEELSSNFNNYLVGGEVENITTAKSLDVGKVDNVESIKYANDGEAKDVVIRSNGGTLSINDTNDNSHQTHFGSSESVTVATGDDCYTCHAFVGSMTVTEGKVVADSGAYVSVTAAAPDVELNESNGGTFVIGSGTLATYTAATDTDSAKGVDATLAATLGYTTDGEGDTATLVVDSSSTLGQDRKTKLASSYVAVSSEKELCQFRDYVNAGINYDDMNVKLTADVTLTSAWTPIGLSGYREAFKGSTSTAPQNLYFAGTFDGNSHTISGLTSNGYTPEYTNSSSGQYAYGLFGSVSGATIKDVTLDNVYISCEKGDGVGALVGFSFGDLTVSGCTVNGAVYGLDAIGGLVGRSYSTSAVSTMEPSKVTITNNTNNANVTSVSGTVSNQRKVAGVLGYVSEYNELKLVGNTNNGSISMTDDTVPGFVAGVCVFGGTTSAKLNGNYNVVIKNNVNAGFIDAQFVTSAAHIACNASSSCFTSVDVTGNQVNGGTLTIQKYGTASSYKQYNLSSTAIVNMSQTLSSTYSGNTYGYNEANDNTNVLNSDLSAITYDINNIPDDWNDMQKLKYVISIGNNDNCSDVAVKDGDTVTIQKDLVLTETLVIYNNITLDLNGHKLSKDGGYVIWARGEVTIKNGSIEGLKKGTGDVQRLLEIGNNCTLEDLHFIGDGSIIVMLANTQTQVDGLVCTVKDCYLNDSLITTTSNGHLSAFHCNSQYGWSGTTVAGTYSIENSEE